MSPPESAPRAEANLLLASLSDVAYRQVAARCEPVPMPFKDVIFRADEPIDYAYFPHRGCLSVITRMDDGTRVEVGTIGREGMVGLSLLHGVDSVPTDCIVQIEGTGMRMRRDAFEAELSENAELAHLIHRYAQVWTDQTARGGSCNGVHSVAERCARWLLLTHDRVESDLLPLTQEFLSVMLGVRRASVTLAVAGLRQAGLVDSKRGQITVLDRPGLEAASCECYAAMQSIYERLLPQIRQ